MGELRICHILVHDSQVVSMQGSRGELEDWPTSKELLQSPQHSLEPEPALISSDPRKGSVVDAIGLEDSVGTVASKQNWIGFLVSD